MIGTDGQAPDAEALEAALAAEGLIDAPLEVSGETVTVWTRLQVPGRHAGGEQLQASVAGWRQPTEGLAWWGRNLALLNGNDRPAGRSVAARQRQLAALGQPDAPLRWVLGADAATALMQQWQPWNRLATVAGGPLAPGLQSLAFALEPEASTARWTARIQFSALSHG